MPELFCPRVRPAMLGANHVKAFKFNENNIIGNGGLGSVYKQHGRSNQKIAVKLAHPSDPDGEFFIRYEARALSRFNHPNIVSFYGHGTTPEGQQFVAMEYIDGKNIADYLNSMPSAHSLSEVLYVTECVACALAHIHDQEWVHADVTPYNILLSTKPGKGSEVKLIDFSLARPEGEWLDLERRPGMVVGNPRYLSLARLTQTRPPGREDDLFALGLTLYEMLTGKKALVEMKNNHLSLCFNDSFEDLCQRIGKLDLPEPVRDLTLRLIDNKFSNCHEVVRFIRRHSMINSVNPRPLLYDTADKLGKENSITLKRIL